MPPAVPALWKDMGPCTGATGTVVLAAVVSYPNPTTTGNTTLYYEITGTTNSANGSSPFVADPGATVSLKIYTVAARMVWSRTLMGQDAISGQHNFAWNGKDNSGAQLANGVYYYVAVLKTQGGQDMKKTPILILR